MRINLLFCLIILPLVFGCAPKENELSGEVFLVTEKGQNIKLNQVEISVIDSAKMDTFAQSRLQSFEQNIKRIKAKTQKAQQEYKKMLQSKEKFYRVYLDNIYSHRYKKKYDDLLAAISKKRKELKQLQSEYDSYFQISYFLVGLPEPVQSAKTETEGKFSIKLKPGRHGLVAHTVLKIENADKDFYWFLWVNTEDNSEQKIILNNDNLFGSECGSCVFNISKLS